LIDAQGIRRCVGCQEGGNEGVVMGGDCCVEMGLVLVDDFLDEEVEHEACGDAADDMRCEA